MSWDTILKIEMRSTNCSTIQQDRVAGKRIMLFPWNVLFGLRSVVVLFCDVVAPCVHVSNKLVLVVN